MLRKPESTKIFIVDEYELFEYPPAKTTTKKETKKVTEEEYKKIREELLREECENWFLRELFAELRRL